MFDVGMHRSDIWIEYPADLDSKTWTRYQFTGPF